MRIVELSQSEKEKLQYLQKYSTNLVERNRSLCLLLSSQGNSMSVVGRMMNIHWHTVKRLLDDWEQAAEDERFSVLRQGKGQGAKVKLEPINEHISALMDKHNRNLNLVLQEIEEVHHIKVCKLTLQNFLKGTGLYLQTNTEIAQK